MNQPLAIVLAAGKGTRMKSELPKVLAPVCGRPMIDYVLDALAAAGVERTLVVVGYRADLVRETLAGRTGVDFVEQREQLGTGHAVQMCLPQLERHVGPVLIVTGDSPLVQPESLRRLLAEFAAQELACLLGTVQKPDPAGLGRIVRDAAGRFVGIVEQRDATPEQLQIQEVNLSCYVFSADDLRLALGRISADNAQRELYLTDCPGVLLRAGRPVDARAILQPVEALSINSPEELALVEEQMRRLAGTSGTPAADR